MPVNCSIDVELGERSYPIVIGNALLGGGYDLGGHLAGDECLVVSNETVAPLYLERLREDLRAFYRSSKYAGSWRHHRRKKRT